MGIDENFEWECGTCRKIHTGLPLDLSFDEPIQVHGVSKLKRLALRIRLNEDFCSINNQDFFIRGVIEIPIIGFGDCFRFGVWSSLSQKNYEYAISTWDDISGRDYEPMFGWLSNELAPSYPGSLHLKTNVYLRPNIRPSIELEPTDHPLAVAQRDGITILRVQEIVTHSLHPV